jgi:hypothetical protein
MLGNFLGYHFPTVFKINVEKYKHDSYLSNLLTRRPDVPEENSFSSLAYSNWLRFKIDVHLVGTICYSFRKAGI